MLLTEVHLPQERPATFPFTVPVIANLQSLPFDAPVTILVGENGSGKSTLLEALAYACELPTAGSDTLDRDDTLAHVRSLGDALRLSWTRRTRRGFFFRAEDFFGYVKAQNRMKRELQGRVKALREEYRDQPELEFERVASPYTSSLAATERRYGADLDANSHGESFLAFFKARLAKGGLYLLDEPEAALSPLRQLAFLSLMKETVAQGGQFIVATHAPILMAYPGASLLAFGDGQVTPTLFDELEHVQLMRDFLKDPELYLRQL